MGKFSLTKKAIDDLNGIWLYTAENWSENQADKYYKLLTDAFPEIADTPKIGRQYKEIDDLTYGLRVGRHIIFYRANKIQNVVILRILHQRMDIQSNMD